MGINKQSKTDNDQTVKRKTSYPSNCIIIKKVSCDVYPHPLIFIDVKRILDPVAPPPASSLLAPSSPLLPLARPQNRGRHISFADADYNLPSSKPRVRRRRGAWA
jgi:hypothetical protein